MPYGITVTEYNKFTERLAKKLKISKARVAAAMDEIVREDVRRIAQNKKEGDRDIE